MIFTHAEHAYLAGHPLGRLATIGPDGAPQIHPVAFWLNDGTGTIDIGGPALARSQKFRNIRADPRVSLVVDDQAETPNPIGQTGRGIEVRGHAEIATLDLPLIAAFSNETLRIYPHRVIAWNIGEFALAPPGRLPHLQGTTPATYPGEDHTRGCVRWRAPVASMPRAGRLIEHGHGRKR